MWQVLTSKNGEAKTVDCKGTRSVLMALGEALIALERDGFRPCGTRSSEDGLRIALSAGPESAAVEVYELN